MPKPFVRSPTVCAPGRTCSPWAAKTPNSAAEPAPHRQVFHATAPKDEEKAAAGSGAGASAARVRARACAPPLGWPSVGAPAYARRGCQGALGPCPRTWPAGWKGDPLRRLHAAPFRLRPPRHVRYRRRTFQAHDWRSGRGRFCRGHGKIRGNVCRLAHVGDALARSNVAAVRLCQRRRRWPARVHGEPRRGATTARQVHHAPWAARCHRPTQDPLRRRPGRVRAAARPARCSAVPQRSYSPHSCTRHSSLTLLSLSRAHANTRGTFRWRRRLVGKGTFTIFEAKELVARHLTPAGASGSGGSGTNDGGGSSANRAGGTAVTAAEQGLSSEDEDEDGEECDDDDDDENDDDDERAMGNTEVDTSVDGLLARGPVSEAAAAAAAAAERRAASLAVAAAGTGQPAADEPTAAPPASAAAPVPASADAILPPPKRARRLAPPPVEFLCPITQEMMVDPVFTTDGHTYEKTAIQRWLTHKRTSPLTGALLSSTNLIPNQCARPPLPSGYAPATCDRSTAATPSLSMCVCVCISGREPQCPAQAHRGAHRTHAVRPSSRRQPFNMKTLRAPLALCSPTARALPMPNVGNGPDGDAAPPAACNAACTSCRHIVQSTIIVDQALRTHAHVACHCCRTPPRGRVRIAHSVRLAWHVPLTVLSGSSGVGIPT